MNEETNLLEGLQLAVTLCAAEIGRRMKEAK